jgi:hypothetical protein
MTYQEKDDERTPIEWDGMDCIMLGTISKAGITRRMDGSLVSDYYHRAADPKRLETFALTGQWLFKN